MNFSPSLGGVWWNASFTWLKSGYIKVSRKIVQNLHSTKKNEHFYSETCDENCNNRSICHRSFFFALLSQAFPINIIFGVSKKWGENIINVAITANRTWRFLLQHNSWIIQRMHSLRLISALFEQHSKQTCEISFKRWKIHLNFNTENETFANVCNR